MEQVVCSLLAYRPSGDVEEEAARWRRWLALRRWRACDYITASLLLVGLEGDGSPSERMRRIACLAFAPDRFLSALDEAACDDSIRLEEADLAIAIGLPLLVAEGLVEAVDPIGMLAPRASGPLQTYVRCALSWRMESHCRPLDVVAIRAQIDRQGLEVEIAALRRTFLAALDHAENIGFRFPLGEHTWDELRKADGMLGVMRAFAESDDAVGLRDWLRACEARGDSYEQLMDEATARVTRIAGDQIDRRKREVCLSRLGEAWSAAQLWVQAIPDDDESSRWAVTSAAQLGILWAPHRDAVARLEAEGGPAAPAIRGLLHLTDDLIKLRSMP
jgi:hypothetical protein